MGKEWIFGEKTTQSLLACLRSLSFVPWRFCSVKEAEGALALSDKSEATGQSFSGRKLSTLLSSESNEFFAVETSDKSGSRNTAEDMNIAAYMRSSDDNALLNLPQEDKEKIEVEEKVWLWKRSWRRSWWRR